MAIDHVRDYFSSSAFLYSPTDLNHTSVSLFFTRWITHYCAPVFIFLAGISANLYGMKRSRKELSLFLLKRGIWLVVAEESVIAFFRTFNASPHFFILHVIWAIGFSMIVLSAIVYMKQPFILLTAVALIAGHNMLDGVHIPGNGIISLLWSLLHEQGNFTFGHFSIHVLYPVLPWVGVIAMGYCFGNLYSPAYLPKRRRKTLLISGLVAILLFIILRSVDLYGDAAHWHTQKSLAYTLLSFLNVTKYPPSLLYLLITLGPALIFLALAEKPLNALTSKIQVFGRVPMFYYLLHILLIHLFAVVGAVLLGYKWTDMILSTSLNAAPQLKGYGFNLIAVYLVWIMLILILYPFCKYFDRYKRANQAQQTWLSYL